MAEGSERTIAAAASDPLPSARSTNATAPISALSRIALQETVAEIAASARQTRAASSVAWHWLRLGAERRLGIEVNIDDPALRELFGHLLQVEGLLGQVRAQGKALVQGASVLAEGSEGSGASITGVTAVGAGASTSAAIAGGAQATTILAESLSMLATHTESRSSHGGSTASSSDPVGNACRDAPAMVRNAVWHTVSLSPNASDSGSARYRMERRLREEVLDPVDNQLAEHDRLRDRLRERQGWRQKLEQCQREVAKLKKSKRSSSAADIGSGLRPLVTGAPTRLGAADEQLRTAQAKVAALDEEVLGRLLDIRNEATGMVSRLWVALARIRAEFFASLAGHWAPIATALCCDKSGSGASKPNGHFIASVVAAAAPDDQTPTSADAGLHTSVGSLAQCTQEELISESAGLGQCMESVIPDAATEHILTASDPEPSLSTLSSKGPHTGASAASADCCADTADALTVVPRFSGAAPDTGDMIAASTEDTADTQDQISHSAQPVADLPTVDESKDTQLVSSQLGPSPEDADPDGVDEEF